jgi:FtsZ-binding cell division protein ZapB
MKRVCESTASFLAVKRPCPGLAPRSFTPEGMAALHQAASDVQQGTLSKQAIAGLQQTVAVQHAVIEALKHDNITIKTAVSGQQALIETLRHENIAIKHTVAGHQAVIEALQPALLFLKQLPNLGNLGPPGGGATRTDLAGALTTPEWVMAR